jgi:hypothetical protein
MGRWYEDWRVEHLHRGFTISGRNGAQCFGVRVQPQNRCGDLAFAMSQLERVYLKPSILTLAFYCFPHLSPREMK